MSLTAAALRLMAEKGLSALDIAEIAEAMEVSTPKSSGAERQKRYRDKQRDVTRDVTRDSNAVTDAPLSSPSPSFPPDPQTNPTPAYPRGEITPARKADDFPKPDWADLQVWSDFMLNRKRKRMTNSATAYRGFLRDIEKHTDPDWPPGRLLEHAAAKGWASINAPDDQDNRHGPRNTQSPIRQGVGDLRGPRPNPAYDLLIQARAELEAGSSEDQGSDSETWAALPAYLRD